MLNTQLLNSYSCPNFVKYTKIENVAHKRIPLLTSIRNGPFLTKYEVWRSCMLCAWDWHVKRVLKFGGKSADVFYADCRICFSVALRVFGLGLVCVKGFAAAAGEGRRALGRRTDVISRL
jgi:hypothetical protein